VFRALFDVEVLSSASDKVTGSLQGQAGGRCSLVSSKRRELL
jgi:hypothetical protein